MFDIDLRYPETPSLVKNFVLNSLRQIKSSKYLKHFNDRFANLHKSITDHIHLVKESSLSELLKK
jgi:hypothetical protein